MSLKDRVALITGASRGIGRGIAIAMAEAGADVVVNYQSNRSAAEETARLVESAGRKALLFEADVRDQDVVKQMVDAAVSTFGKVDILVHNAGIIDRDSYVYDVDLAKFREMIDGHIMGAFHCIQAVLPVMREQPRGDIHLISSMNVRTMPDGVMSYNVAKAGLEALAQCLAKEERSNDIRVNVIAPTLVKSDMGSEYLKRAGLSSFEELDKYMPFDRVVEPKDVANLCVFLASEEGSHISGQVITVNAAQGSGGTAEFVPKR